MLIKQNVRNLIKKKLIEDVPEHFKETVRILNTNIDRFFPVRNILIFFGRIKTEQDIEEDFKNLKEIK